MGKAKIKVILLYVVDNSVTAPETWHRSGTKESAGSPLGASVSRGPWKFKKCMTFPAPDLYFIMTLISCTESLPHLLSGPPEFNIARTSPNHWPHILLGSHRILELLGSWRGSIPFWDSGIRAEGLSGFALELHSFYFSHKNRVRGQFPHVLHFHLCSSLDLIGSCLPI